MWRSWWVGEPVRVRLRGLGSIEGRVARARNGRIGIAFDATDSPARGRLIVQLFTRGMNATQLQVPLWRATRTMLARILTADMSLPTAPTGQAATRPELSDDRLEKRTYVLPPENRTPATMRLARAS